MYHHVIIINVHDVGALLRAYIQSIPSKIRSCEFSEGFLVYLQPLIFAWVHASHFIIISRKVNGKCARCLKPNLMHLKSLMLSRIRLPILD